VHRVVTWVGGLISAPRWLPALSRASGILKGSICSAWLASGLLLIPALVAAQTWQYLYDEVGRLKSAIAPSGDRADYEYDAVGNIVAIRRSSAGALNISEFTPQIGKSGTSVKLIGSGFSTTLASNVVKFNGVTATVTAATATQLTVSAPATGSTGPISVTVGAATATTREVFVYSSTTITGPPTIVSVSSSCAAPGSTVALTGTNFDVAPGATRVELGSVAAATTVTSPTSLSFVVPLGATSTTRVVTPLGISASSAQLFVPPLGTCAEYETPIRPVLDGAANAMSIAAGKKAVILVSGNAGAALSLQFSNVVVSAGGTGLPYTVYNTANASMTGGTVTAYSASIHLPVLPTVGMYAVVLMGSDPSVTGTASVKLQTDATLTTAGTALNTGASTVGQSARVVFAGTAGQDWTLNLSALALGSGSSAMYYSVKRASDGQQVLFGYCYPNGAGCSETWHGITTGVHSLVVAPYPASATAGVVTLKSWASSRVTGTLAIGTSVTYSSTVPGQVVQYTFNGTAGQQLGLALSNFSASAGGSTLNTSMQVVVLKPDGTTLTSGGFLSGSTSSAPVVMDLPALPIGGTYTVRVHPNVDSGDIQQTATFTGQVLVSGDVTANLATNGTPTTVTLAQSGQTARLTFSGTAGQDWTLNLSALSMSGSNPTVSYNVYRPDGTTYVTWGTCSPNGNNCSASVLGLPVTGIYSIVFIPNPAGSTGNFTVKSWASSRVTGTLTIGTAATYTSTIPGQVVQYTFSGTAGQQLGLTLSNFTTSVGGTTLSAQVLKPDGTQLIGTTITAANTSPTPRVLDLPVLPTGGTYVVRVSPTQDGYVGVTTTFSGQVLVSSDVTGSLATNGTPTTVSLAQPGQTARLSFSGTAGQDWTMNVSALSLSGSNPTVSFNVYRPDGTTYVTGGGPCNPSGTNCSASVLGLPVTGSYTVVFTPNPVGSTGSFTVKSWASSRVTGTLTIGTPATYTSTVPGQVVQYTFSGTAGQQLGLSLSNFTTSVSGAALNVEVVTPSATNLTSGVFTPGATPNTFVLDLPALPTTGSYTVRVSPYPYPSSGQSMTFTGQVLVSSDVTASLATNGTPTTVTLAQPGQTARLTFNGTAGQDWTVNLSALSMSGSNPTVSYTVNRPDGTYVTSGTCNPNGNNCSASVRVLPVTGNYAVVFTPNPAGSTGNFTVKSWASSRVTGTLTIGTAATYTSTVPGQVVQYTFSGTAGQQLGLSLSNFTSSVSAANLSLEILTPSGGNWVNTVFSAVLTTPNAFILDIPALPTTGTYTVRVSPYPYSTVGQITTFSGQVLVTPDIVTTLPTNGAATAIGLTQPGQQARASFAAANGEDWTLYISGLTLSAGGQYVAYQVLNASGFSLTSGQCNATGAGCVKSLRALASGTYTVLLEPYPAWTTASFTLKSWISNRVTGVLTIGTPVTSTTTAAGQMAQYTFSGTAGQQLNVNLSNFTTSVSGASLQASVVKPDGSALSNNAFTAANTAPSPYSVILPVLPATGTYTLQLSPVASGNVQQTSTFSGQVLVATGTGGTPGGTLPTDGTAKDVTFVTPGEIVELSFAVVAGEEIAIYLEQLVLNGGTNDSVQFSLIPPVGSAYSPVSCYETGAGCNSTYLTLGYSGTYKLRLVAQSGLTGSVRIKAWKYVALSGPISIGTPLTVTTQTPSQTGRYTLSGTAGQTLRLTLSNASSSTGAAGISVSVFAPDWTTVGFKNVSVGGTASLDLPALTLSGTYSVNVNGYPYGKTFSVQVLIAPR
jgi:YD repeat-containing protein